jgi:hypothetical protein
MFFAITLSPGWNRGGVSTSIRHETPVVSAVATISFGRAGFKPGGFSDAGDPVHVVGGAEILDLSHAFDRVADLVDIVEPGRAGKVQDTVGAAFPRLMEGRLVGLALDRAEALHTAEIVHTVHVRSSSKVSSATE